MKLVMDYFKRQKRLKFKPRQGADSRLVAPPAAAVHGQQEEAFVLTFSAKASELLNS